MKSEDIFKRITSINQKSLSLYLDFFGFSNVKLSFENEYKETFDTFIPDSFKGGENVLEITDKSAESTISYEQFLYDIEVFDTIYSDIRDRVTFARFCEFYKAIYKKMYDTDWRIVFAGRNYFSERIEKSGINVEYLQLDKCYPKTVVIKNTSEDISEFMQRYRSSHYIVLHFALELIREWLIFEICDYFKAVLAEKNVTLVLCNWEWGRNNFLYPDADITTEKIEQRSKFCIYNIADVESEYADFLSQLYPGASQEYIKNIFDIPPKLDIAKGKIRHADKESEYLNVLSGERFTPEQPEDFDNTIYMLGGCVFFGYAVDDAHTIAALLQEKLNENCRNKKWRVRNYATWGGNIDQTYKALFDLEYRSGDMVFISYAGLLPIGDCDISDDMEAAYKGHEFYYDCVLHCNADGYRQVAENIYRLYSDRFEADAPFGEPFMLENNDSSSYIDESINEYISGVKNEIGNIYEGKKTGAIVMNCNPFTLGHRYLIESAAKQVDLLIIFVVEENKSFFKFEDRIKLVKAGTSDLENVRVVPSGRFIISTATFPGYFMKKNPDSAVLDSSKDVEMFGKKIAPPLGISVRFVGEEPFDVVTRRYNETMKSVLPEFGIELIEIPRKKTGDKVISATTVRALLEEQNFAEISKFVPKTTLDYLEKNFKK